MANGHDAPWWVNALKWTAEKMGVAAIVLAFIGAGTWYAGSWLGGFVDRAYDDLAKPIAIEHLAYLRSNVKNTDRMTTILANQEQTLQAILVAHRRSDELLLEAARTASTERDEILEAQTRLLEVIEKQGRP